MVSSCVGSRITCLIILMMISMVNSQANSEPNNPIGATNISCTIVDCQNCDSNQQTLCDDCDGNLVFTDSKC